MYLHNLFKILLHGWFIWSPFNHLFIAVWNPGFLLLALGCLVQDYFILLLKWFQCWPLSVGFFVVLSAPILWTFLFLFWRASLLSGTRRPSRLLLCSCSHPRINRFSRSLGFFYWRMELETKIQVLELLLVANGVSFLLGLFSWQKKKLFVC